MAERGPPAPTPKPVRKPATQVKVKEPSKNASKTKPLKGCPSIGTKSGNTTGSACRPAWRSSPSLSTKSTKPVAW